MPRPRVSYGRPGTTVVPDRWAEDMRPVAEGAMNGTAALRVPGTVKGAFNETTGTWAQVAPVAYATVPARVQALTTQSKHPETAEDQVTVTGYLVAIPAATTGVAIGHLAAISGTGDPLIDGKTLRVDDIVRGSHLAERDLFCSLTTP